MYPWLNYLHHQPHITIELTPSGIEAQILTERLLIRTYRDEDFEHYIPLYSDEKLLKYFEQGKPLTQNEIKSLVQVRGTDLTKNGHPFGLFSIFSRENGTFLGQGDLLPINGMPGVLEIGLIFHRNTHNKGFGIEASKFLAFNFADLLRMKNTLIQGSVLSKIIASVHPKNYPSIRILEMLGSRLEKSEDRFGKPRLWYSYEVGSISFKKEIP